MLTAPLQGVGVWGAVAHSTFCCVPPCLASEGKLSLISLTFCIPAFSDKLRLAYNVTQF
jgi:hypothetical protein